MDWMEIASQAGIFVGALSVFFLGRGNRWGFALGLAVQPFWYYTSFIHGQWGLMAASVIYTYGWVEGFHRTFIKKEPVVKPRAVEQ